MAKLVSLQLFPIVALVVLVVALGALTRVVERDVTVMREETLVQAETAQRMKLAVVQVQQWLTDISATRGLDGLDDGFAKAEENRQVFLAGAGDFRHASNAVVTSRPRPRSRSWSRPSSRIAPPVGRWPMPTSRTDPPAGT